MQLHIISSFHYDYLYLEGSEEYLRISFDILDKALELLEKEPEWHFTVEQVILLEAYLKRFPEKTSVMRRFVQQGRLAFAPGMYVMPDMNMIDVESLCLQVKYGKAFLEENFGADAKVCWIADCWGHHAQLPQILKQCGYEGYFFWRCMRPELLCSDFSWIGADGSAMTAHWLATGYGDLSFPSEDAVMHAEELSFAAGTAEDISKRLNKVTVASEKLPRLLCNGGDFRVPQGSCVRTVKELGRTPGMPEMFFSTPEKFLTDLQKFDLPQVSGEFNGAFQGCFSSNILIKQLLWYNREQLLARESFAALTGTGGVSDAEWKQLLRHYFHDTVCGTVCDEALREAVAELRALKKGEGEAVFNPILRSRREIVDHREITLSPLESRQWKEFPELPALKTVTSGGSFTNRFFRCTYDDRGRIISLKSACGRELIDGTSPAWFGLPVMQMDAGDNWLLYEAPLNGGSDAAALTSNRPDPPFREPAQNGLVYRSPFMANVEHTEIRCSDRECIISLRGNMTFWQLRVDFELTVAMDDLSPLIKFKLEILSSGKHYRLRAAFPTVLAGGTVHHGIPGGFQKRSHCEYPADGYSHLGDERGGVFLLNRGLPGNNADENGVMLLSLFRSVAMEYKCQSEASFNIGVPHTFEYAVLPHDGELYSDETAAAIETYLRPLQRTAGCSSRGFLPELPANVRLFALRKHPRGIFMRFGEVWGKTAQYALPVPCIPADALEKAVAPETAEVLSFKYFEIKNVILPLHHLKNFC